MSKPDTIGCPANIEFLLHCHTSPLPFQHSDAGHYIELTRAWLDQGVIAEDGNGIFRTTALGSAWVKALCNVEKPRLAYVDAQGNFL